MIARTTALLVCLLLASVKTAPAQFFDQLAMAEMLNHRAASLAAIPEISYEYYKLTSGTGNSVYARNTFFLILGKGDALKGQERAMLVGLLNRITMNEVFVNDSLAVPTQYDLDFRAYSPFPRYYDGGREFDKLFVLDKTLQAFAAYEYGELVRWGIINTGNPDESPTPNGRYNFNWKEEYRVSSLSPPGEEWQMYWVVNFHQDRGMHIHQYEMPTGGPTSHGCVRLVDADAEWAYNWVDTWKTTRPGDGFSSGSGHILEQGTTVIVIGTEPAGRPQPFRFEEYGPVLQRVELPAHPYDIPPGTAQQRYFDKQRPARPAVLLAEDEPPAPEDAAVAEDTEDDAPADEAPPREELTLAQARPVAEIDAPRNDPLQQRPLAQALIDIAAALPDTSATTPTEPTDDETPIDDQTLVDEETIIAEALPADDGFQPLPFIDEPVETQDQPAIDRQIDDDEQPAEQEAMPLAQALTDDAAPPPDEQQTDTQQPLGEETPANDQLADDPQPVEQETPIDDQQETPTDDDPQPVEQETPVAQALTDDEQETPTDDQQETPTDDDQPEEAQQPDDDAQPEDDRQPAQEETAPARFDPERVSWTIVLASSATQTEAEALLSAYRQVFGETVYPVDVIEQQGQYRVVVGQFETLAATNAAQQELNADLPVNAWLLYADGVTGVTLEPVVADATPADNKQPAEEHTPANDQLADDPPSDLEPTPADEQAPAETPDPTTDDQNDDDQQPVEQETPVAQALTDDQQETPTDDQQETPTDDDQPEEAQQPDDDAQPEDDRQPAQEETAPARFDPERVSWTIVLASSATQTEAEALLSAYRQVFGETVYPVDVIEQQGQYRVVVGQFETLAATNAAQQELNADLPDGAWLLYIDR